MPEEVESSPRRRSKLEDQVARLEGSLAAKRSRLELKKLAQSKGGQKLLRSMKTLSWLIEHAQEYDPALVKAASDARALLSNALTRRYSILPSHILPAEAAQAEEQALEEL